MDIFSHGLWGGVAFGRKSRLSFWTAFLFGVLPDFLAFGPLFIWLIIEWVFLGGSTSHPEPGNGYANIPHYVFSVYNVTHSLIMFLSAFLLVWVIRKKPMWEMSAWGFHVLLDIFTHDKLFFPTPFLWPISDYNFSGVSWGHPIIFFPNVILLTCLYTFWWYKRRKMRNIGKKVDKPVEK